MLSVYVMKATQSSPIPWQVWLFILAGVALVVWPAMYIFFHYRKQRKQQDEKSTPKPVEVSEKATVVDLGCWVRTVGHKTPKTITKFAVVFLTEDGQELKLNIPEEMYHGLEKGQTGIVTLRNGKLYSFELD